MTGQHSGQKCQREREMGDPEARKRYAEKNEADDLRRAFEKLDTEKHAPLGETATRLERETE